MTKRVLATNDTIQHLVELGIERHGNNADLNYIDTRRVTNMANLFHTFKKFDGDISKWDVSNVKTMNCMFAESSFNGDISGWNVSNVHDMGYMFSGSSFDGDISRWDVSNVTNMLRMFAYSHFNGDISKWDIGNVRNMASMFSDSRFNGDIKTWKVSEFCNIFDMFECSKVASDTVAAWNLKSCYIPDQANRIGYKKVIMHTIFNHHIYGIVKLQLPDDAIISHNDTSVEKKCRTNKCKVIGMYHCHRLFGLKIPLIFTKNARSWYDINFKYHVGQEIEVNDFDTCTWNDCSSGIHFFQDFIDAVKIVL